MPHFFLTFLETWKSKIIYESDSLLWSQCSCVITRQSPSSHKIYSQVRGREGRLEEVEEASFTLPLGTLFPITNLLFVDCCPSTHPWKWHLGDLGTVPGGSTSQHSCLGFPHIDSGRYNQILSPPSEAFYIKTS